MRIELTVDEALRLAQTAGPLPPVVRSVRADGDAVLVELDPRLVPGLGGAVRLAASLAGVVPVVARFIGFADGAAAFALGVSVRGFSVQSLVSTLAGTIEQQVARQGLPPGAVTIRRDPDGPVAVVALQTFVAHAVTDVTVTDFLLRDGALLLAIAVGPRPARVERGGQTAGGGGVRRSS